MFFILKTLLARNMRITFSVHQVRWWSGIQSSARKTLHVLISTIQKILKGCFGVAGLRCTKTMFPTPRVGWVEDVPSWPHLCSDADLLPVGNLQQTFYTKPLFVQHTTPGCQTRQRKYMHNLNQPSVGVACEFEGGCLWSSFDMMVCIDTRHVCSKYAAPN